jgi:chaperone required for assembly of F1-ATPase
VKRFWEAATIAPADVEDEFIVLLDDRPLHLPSGATLRASGEVLARAIAEEWQTAGGAKGGDMSFADTPLTRLVGTAQERIAPDPEETIEAIARYGETDLLCYRASEPPSLVARQAERWQPWLDWAARELDAPLKTTTGVIHIPQEPKALAALRRAVAAQPPLTLAALGVAVPDMGSLVLGLALAAGRLDPAEAHSLATLDELYQAELWGEDAQAIARRRCVAKEIALAARLISLARNRPPRSKRCDPPHGRSMFG